MCGEEGASNADPAVMLNHTNVLHVLKNVTIDVVKTGARQSPCSFKFQPRLLIIGPLPSTLSSGKDVDLGDRRL